MMGKNNIFGLLAIIVLGLSLRLFLASLPYNPNNNDMVNALKLTNFLREGKNIYLSIGQENFGYNIGPIYFTILGFLDKFFHFLPFPFVLRAFLSLIDLLSLFVLIGIAGQKKISVIKAAGFFFLNPISIIISGYHGQLDNMAIFFLLLALLTYESKKIILRNIKSILIFILLTFGLIVKHTIFMQVFILFLYLVKDKIKAMMLFAGSLIVFFLSFLPYTQEAYMKVIKLITTYSGVPAVYGVTSVLYMIYTFIFGKHDVCYSCNPPGTNLNFSILFAILTYAFILFYFLFALYISSREKDLRRSLLVSFLFFLTFTPGIGAYFIWPVALGALYPSFWFLLYSFIVLLYYLGANYVFNIPYFSWIPLNLIWVVTIIWFVAEVKKLKYDKIFS